MAYTSFQTQPIGIFSAIGSAFKSLFASFEYAGMMRALMRMSDDQLAQIGIKRADIPAYADELLGRTA